MVQVTSVYRTIRNVCPVLYFLFLSALEIEPRPPAWVECALTIGPCYPMLSHQIKTVGVHFTLGTMESAANIPSPTNVK